MHPLGPHGTGSRRLGRGERARRRSLGENRCGSGRARSVGHHLRLGTDLGARLSFGRRQCSLHPAELGLELGDALVAIIEEVLDRRLARRVAGDRLGSVRERARRWIVGEDPGGGMLVRLSDGSDPDLELRRQRHLGDGLGAFAQVGVDEIIDHDLRRAARDDLAGRMRRQLTIMVVKRASRRSGRVAA